MRKNGSFVKMNAHFTSLEVTVENALQFFPVDLHIGSGRMPEDEADFAILVEIFLTSDLQIECRREKNRKKKPFTSVRRRGWIMNRLSATTTSEVSFK